MKAVTVRQPWAFAIALGFKLVENRSRGTEYRGPLAIHAGTGYSKRGDSDPRITALFGSDPRVGMPIGAFIAVATLVDSHPDDGCCRPWGESEYVEAGGRVQNRLHHLVLQDVQRIMSMHCAGRLGIWNVPTDLEQRFIYLDEEDL